MPVQQSFNGYIYLQMKKLSRDKFSWIFPKFKKIAKICLAKNCPNKVSLATNFQVKISAWSQNVQIHKSKTWWKQSQWGKKGSRLINDEMTKP